MHMTEHDGSARGSQCTGLSMWARQQHFEFEEVKHFGALVFSVMA
jgi:hypothetical protein